MSKPTFEVIIRTLCPLRDDGSSPNCSDCEEKDRCEADEGALEANEQEQIAALTSALKELGVDVPQWMPIETAPKDNSEVLVITNNGTMYIAYWYTTEKEWRSEGFKIEPIPTLWMPLPNKPKE